MKSTKPSGEKSQKVKDALDYPGVANNRADDDKTTERLVKEDVRDLNNNPRGQELEGQE